MQEESRVSNRAERIRLDIWHPDCWTLQVTEATDAGLIAYGVYDLETAVKARIVAYGDDVATIDDVVAATRASPFTDAVHEMDHAFGASKAITAGNATRELLVTYRSDESIHEALVSRGLIPDAPIRIRDGRERWTVLAEADVDLQECLDEVRREMNAEIAVTGTGSSVATVADLDDRLTERQREVFEAARCRGYYDLPRRITSAALADELGIAKATLLEHLRKAESKLLDP